MKGRRSTSAPPASRRAHTLEDRPERSEVVVKRTSRIPLLLLVAVAVVAASCGDDGDGGGAPTTTAAATADGSTTTAAGPATTAARVDPKLCPVKALETARAPVEVSFWHSMSAANEDALKKLAEKYNTGQNKVKVTLTRQGTYDESLQKYVAAVRGGDLPLMIQTEETAMQTMIDSKSIVPIGACVAAENYDTNDYSTGLLAQYSVGGVLQTMPFQLSNPILYFDKKVFRAAGLDPEKPPTTLNEILEASRKIVATGKAKGATDKAFALEIQAWYPEQFMSKAGEAIVDNDNGRAARATAAKLDSKTFTDTLQWIATMNKEGLLLNTGRNPAGQSHLLAVASGGVAMTFGTSAALGTVYQLLPNFPNVELGLAPLPGPSGAGVTVGGGSLYMTNKSSDEQKAAVWDFMKFLNTPESQVFWHTSTGYIPTRQSATRSAEVQKFWSERPGFKIAYDQLAAAKPPVGGGGPLIGDYLGFRAALEAALESVVDNGDVAKAQSKAQADATKAITDYNKRIGS
jgi:sn-glycerol 3-phosphate transport system substrate-binding protein